MTKLIKSFLLPLASLAVIAACVREMPNSETRREMVTISASIPEATKVAFEDAENNGLALSWEDGDDIVSFWNPSKHYQGWVDTMHGGILSTLIDETCGWVVTRKAQTCGFTANLNVRFRKPISSNDTKLTIRAHIVKQVRNLLTMHAQVTNSADELCTEAEVTYFLVSPEKAQEMGFATCELED